MWRAWGENHFRCVEVEDLGELSNVTIDGRHPAPVLRLVVFSIIYIQGFLYPRWLFGISEPSTGMFWYPSPPKKKHCTAFISMCLGASF